MRWALACVIVALCLPLPAMAGEWVPLTPDVDNDLPEEPDSDDGKSDWTITAAEDGLEATATVQMIDHYQTTTYTSPADLKATAQRTIGYSWSGCENWPDAANFSLTWSGNVTNTSTNTMAEQINDMAWAQEYSIVDVTSPQFTDGDTDKWACVSKQHAQLDANPEVGKEAYITDENKISYGAGLPTSLTGSVTYSFFQMLRDQTRTKGGPEASSTLQAGASSASYAHPGTYKSTTTVTAKAYHHAAVLIKGKSGDGWFLFDDPDYDSDATALAETTSFSVSK